MAQRGQQRPERGMYTPPHMRQKQDASLSSGTRSGPEANSRFDPTPASMISSPVLGVKHAWETAKSDKRSVQQQGPLRKQPQANRQLFSIPTNPTTKKHEWEHDANSRITKTVISNVSTSPVRGLESTDTAASKPHHHESKQDHNEKSTKSTNKGRRVNEHSHAQDQENHTLHDQDHHYGLHEHPNGDHDYLNSTGTSLDRDGNNRNSGMEKSGKGRGRGRGRNRGDGNSRSGGRGSHSNTHRDTEDRGGEHRRASPETVGHVRSWDNHNYYNHDRNTYKHERKLSIDKRLGPSVLQPNRTTNLVVSPHLSSDARNADAIVRSRSPSHSPTHRSARSTSHERTTWGVPFAHPKQSGWSNVGIQSLPHSSGKEPIRKTHNRALSSATHDGTMPSGKSQDKSQFCRLGDFSIPTVLALPPRPDQANIDQSHKQRQRQMISISTAHSKSLPGEKDLFISVDASSRSPHGEPSSTQKWMSQDSRSLQTDHEWNNRAPDKNGRGRLQGSNRGGGHGSGYGGNGGSHHARDNRHSNHDFNHREHRVHHGNSHGDDSRQFAKSTIASRQPASTSWKGSESMLSRGLSHNVADPPSIVVATATSSCEPVASTSSTQSTKSTDTTYVRPKIPANDEYVDWADMD
ncbi:hypothetical protein QVD99_002825 [Batrachochytrium dendrobatidis]|nr:hypothetical protein O5D80_007049 [Batrachochytrium dendrobatidis]KAK5671064.1 hypothetical protein QVD99_002825 [Batrachochytrium dendrobatidis]